MPISALPPELQDVENHFPDDDQFGTNWFGKAYRWYQKKTKTWFCFSYRCTEWWARWRKYPKVLFAIGGKGSWRWEWDGGDFNCPYNPLKCPIKHVPSYLSRIQYWKRWHLAVQWPLMFSFHFYFRAKDVPAYSSTNQYYGNLDNKLFYFYLNHFDADLVYWMLTSFFVGLCWK